MTPSEQRNEMQNFLDLLAEASLSLTTTTACKEGTSPVRVSWPSGGSTSVFNGNGALLDEYCAFVRERLYSAVLLDGSLLQLSYEINRNTVVRHRLCYVPSPFEFDEDLLREEPIVDVVEYYRQQAPTALRPRSPVRFDYDADAERANHPASHLTMLDPNCRWAVSSPLCLGLFVRWVFRHFYSDFYGVHPFLRWPIRNLGTKCIRTADEHELHIAWIRAASRSSSD